MPLALILLAFLLALIQQIKARGQSLTDWAVLALALALLWPLLPLR